MLLVYCRGKDPRWEIELFSSGCAVTLFGLDFGLFIKGSVLLYDISSSSKLL